MVILVPLEDGVLLYKDAMSSQTRMTGYTARDAGWICGHTEYGISILVALHGIILW
jgi:hypothetical protein